MDDMQNNQLSKKLGRLNQENQFSHEQSNSLSKNSKKDSKILMLEQPISQGERRVDRLFLGAIKVRHIRAMDGSDGEVGATLALASSLCGEPVSILEEISLEDYEKLVGVLDELSEKKSHGSI